MRTRIAGRTRRAFTLIEILIVVVILGILAAIVIPQFTDASEDAMDASVRSQLQTLRSQIELYNIQNPATAFGPATPVATFWDPLLTGNYLQTEPRNPMQNNSTSVAVAPGAGVGWVWFESVPGQTWSLGLYAVDATGALFQD
ncbi:MAG: type II secretion system protein [Planctomycetota bacterium]|jgi:prepilin-type N-terminal cleavage/methylation domain-containing protein